MFELTSTSSGVIRLVLTWKPPPRPYGKIENYQIRILRQSKKSNDVVKSAIQVATTFKEQVKFLLHIMTEFKIYYCDVNEKFFITLRVYFFYASENFIKFWLDIS